MSQKQRNGVLINGALMVLGALAIIDNIVVHWVLELHRVYEGEWTFQMEFVLVALGAVLLVIGLWREVRARRRR
jgi:uncharacterized membrane protein